MSAVLSELTAERRELEAEAIRAAAELGHDVHSVFVVEDDPCRSKGTCRKCGVQVRVNGRAAPGGVLVCGDAVTYRCAA